MTAKVRGVVALFLFLAVACECAVRHGERRTTAPLHLETLGKRTRQEAVQRRDRLISGDAASQPPEVIVRPDVPLPLQPFTVELLDLERGRWHFEDALGQHLRLEEPVRACAFTPDAPDKTRFAYLCCDPEFPDDLRHAVLKVVHRVHEDAGGTALFRINEPYFECTVAATRAARNLFRCELRNVRLGPATPGDRYVAGMYVLAGRSHAIWRGRKRTPSIGAHCQIRCGSRLRCGSVLREIPAGLVWIRSGSRGHACPARDGRCISRYHSGRRLRSRLA